MNQNEVVISKFENGKPRETKEVINGIEIIRYYTEARDLLFYEHYILNGEILLAKEYTLDSYNRLRRETQMQDGYPHGLEKTYNRDGSLQDIKAYYKGKPVFSLGSIDADTIEKLEMIARIPKALEEHAKEQKMTIEK